MLDQDLLEKFVFSKDKQEFLDSLNPNSENFTYFSYLIELLSDEEIYIEKY